MLSSPILTMRVQQVFDADEFTAFGLPLLIDQIAFRPDAGNGNPFVGTWPHVRIDLSTTSSNPDLLSTTFANNIGADNTTVFDGPLTLSSADTGPAGGPKDFDIIMNFTTPFLYDFTLGNLLLDIRNFGNGPVLLTQFDAQNRLGDSISRVRAGPSTPRP